MKIGIQGIKGSNSEAACNKFVKELNLKDVKIVPLVSSKNVVNELILGNINLGVMATNNTTAGEVKETKEAIKNKNLTVLKKLLLPINHFVFVKNEDVNIEDIKHVTSHPQALKQCKNNINKYFNNVEIKEIEDTAIGAYKLWSGEYNEGTAVICSKKAGTINNLHLLHSNFEDNKNNATEFGLFKKES